MKTCDLMRNPSTKVVTPENPGLVYGVGASRNSSWSHAPPAGVAGPRDRINSLTDPPERSRAFKSAPWSVLFAPAWSGIEAPDILIIPPTLRGHRPMASIADLCWTTSEDLFVDIDLDTLYVRQLRTMGAEDYATYPYLLLVHTGKITIGIGLGNRYDFGPGEPLRGLAEKSPYDDALYSWGPTKEPSE